MNSLVSPQRNGRPMPQPVSQDPRTTLPRRFTTDSGRVPTLSTISTQRLPEAPEYAAVSLPNPDLAIGTIPHVVEMETISSMSQSC